MEPLWILAYLVLWIVLLVACLIIFAVSQEITELHKRMDMLYKFLMSQSSKNTDVEGKRDMLLPDTKGGEELEDTVNFDSLGNYTMDTAINEESNMERK